MDPDSTCAKTGKPACFGLYGTKSCPRLSANDGCDYAMMERCSNSRTDY